MHSHLDKKLRRRSLRLIRKICEARAIVPSSYELEEEHIHIKEVQYHGGFADVSDGEYQGRAVAVKCLRMNKSFKVFLVNLVNHFCSLSLSGCVERLSSGNICLTLISCPCSGFPSLPTHIGSVSSLSGCLTEISCSMQGQIARQIVCRW